MNTKLHFRIAITILWILPIASCSNWEPEQCAKGGRCPSGFICAPNGTVCINTARPCGNKIVDTIGDYTEVCDDGNHASGDGCSADCLSNEICGNGVRDEGEDCDPKDPITGSTCSADCTFARCGNGIIDPGEECEIENGNISDNCQNCMLPSCGNGLLEEDKGEECDCGRDGANLDFLPAEECNEQRNSDDGGHCRTDCILNCNDGRVNAEEKTLCDSDRFCAHDPESDFHMGRVACNQCEPDYALCRRVEWSKLSSPLAPHRWDAWGVWGTSNKIRFYGGDGKVFDYKKNNNSWEYHDISPPEEHGRIPFSDVWGGTSNLYVVGANGLILRYKEGENGNKGEWARHIAKGSSDQETRDLLAVWGSNPLIYAVGDRGAIFRSTDGTSWDVALSPTKDQLFDVWGEEVTNESDLSDQRFLFFAVGQSGTVLYTTDRDSSITSEWKLMASHTSHTLLSVWGTLYEGNRIKLFAVGEAGTILHYTGTIDTGTDRPGLSGQWSIQPSPTAARLSKVWGKSKDDVYAAGRDGTLLHYDGVLWAPVRPDQSRLSQIYFNSIGSSPVAPNSVFFVSEAGNVYEMEPQP